MGLGSWGLRFRVFGCRDQHLILARQGAPMQAAEEVLQLAHVPQFRPRGTPAPGVVPHVPGKEAAVRVECGGLCGKWVWLEGIKRGKRVFGVTKRKRGLLNPLSLTPSRLPRFSANERCPFPHAFSCQRRKNRGESNILEMKFSRSPSRLIDFHREKTCVVACGTQNFFANAIVTGNSPRCDRRRK